MKTLQIAAFAVAVSLCGCVNIKAPEKIDFNWGDQDDDGDRDRRDDDSSNTSRPGQIPSGGSLPDIFAGAAGAVLLGAEHGVLFYAFDTLAYPNEPIELAANLQSIRNMKGIAGVTVAFYDGKELIDTARTDAAGLATAQWTPPKAGNYAFTARIVKAPDGAPKAMGDVTPAPLLVAARNKDEKFVVIDLDHTVVDSSFFRVLTLGAKRMADSVEVTNRIAGLYSIVYLTHRPELLTRKSKSWLKNNGYPEGPLLVSELKQALGDSGKFKTAKLTDLRKAFANVKIGIGDKPSDAHAYVDNGLTAYLIPHYKEKPKDMRKMAGEIRRLRGRRRLHVVDGWREIEAGIFRGRKFPPETFARRLEKLAKQLEEDQARRDKDDDDA